MVVAGHRAAHADSCLARLPNPEVHLAAWGVIIFSLALIIEAPVIMMLAASIALSRDWDSYRTLRRYMISLGLAMTAAHVLVAPLRYVISSSRPY